MYISRCDLQDFRCFKRVSVRFRTPRPKGRPQQNVTVLLGVNGAGKSSLLQGIVLGVLNEALRDTGILFRNLVRKGSEKGLINPVCLFDAAADGGLTGEGEFICEVEPGLSGDVVRLANITAGTLANKESLAAWQRAARDRRAASLFLVAYGAQRRPSQGALFDLDRQDKRFHLRAQRVASVFVDDAGLIPLAAWWPKFSGRAEVQELLDKVLPEEVRLTSKLDESGELLVQFRGQELPETALSDGYRAFIGWFGDLLYRLSQVQESGSKLTKIKGVVLIDEVDLHLHPTWQQTVIDSISKALPALQFIVSTHSPLIVGGVHRESLRVLRVDAAGELTVEEPSEETYGRTPDQILLSDTFALTHVRPAKFVADLAKVREEMLTGDVDAAVKYTRMLALGEAGKDTV